MLRHSPYLHLSFRSVLLPPSPGLLPAVPLCSYRPNGFRPLLRRRFCRPAAVDEKLPPYDGKAEIPDDLIDDQSAEKDAGNGGLKKDEFPSGDLEFRPFGLWRGFVVKLRMLFSFPWERVRKGSVLSMKLRGPISDQLQGRFSSRLSLPQICENLIKAAYDPRISGIFLQIEPLQCGWGKIEEIRRHIIGFKKSGKFIVSYVPVCQEKEYYLASACGELYVPPSAYIGLYGLKVEASFLRGVFEKIGIEPQIQRIGKYKSAGDTFSRKNLSEENREMLTRLLDNIYENWLKTISSMRGKERDEIENFLDEGIYEVQKLKDGGWITDINYEDEVMKMLKERSQQKGEKLLTVDYKKYSKVRNWTLGLTGGKDQIAIIRASGSISRVRGPLSVGGSGIIAEQFIEKIRSVRESKKYKAAVIRIDSPGGDALASDLMWREIRLLGESMPVVASMSDVAASGGYYMAMAAGVIVAEDLTLTGSIGVVTGKFNLGDLYERIGFNKEVISRGKFAELNVEQRSFRPDEAELFARSTQKAYKLFRDKAAFSRSMSVDEMEEVAQGRVWTGSDAVSRGLVDAIGGVSRAIAIARMKANIPPEREVKLVEVSKPSSSLLEILSSTSGALVGVDSTVRDLWQGLSSYKGVQARMDGIMIEGLDGVPNIRPIFTMIKDYLSSL